MRILSEILLLMWCQGSGTLALVSKYASLPVNTGGSYDKNPRLYMYGTKINLKRHSGQSTNAMGYLHPSGGSLDLTESSSTS